MKTYKGFSETIGALKAGKKLRHATWDNTEYFYLKDNKVIDECDCSFSLNYEKEYIEYQEPKKQDAKLDELSQWIRGVELLANDAHEKIDNLANLKTYQDIQAQADTIEKLEAELEELKEKYTWKSYPENKPKKDGCYLTRNLDNRININNYDAVCKTFFYGGILSFTEIPAEGE